MGGSAFASLNPPLYTPRMPPSVYEYILDRVQELLRQHYTHVGAAIEAPGKLTYGDVDILVFGPVDPLEQVVTPTEHIAERLGNLLGATNWNREKNNPTVNFALPWPQHLLSEVGMQEEDADATEKAKFVQVDVHICVSEQLFKWEHFHAGHGDLWNILGATIRRFGLTANDKGLYLRIPEIELLDRKKSMVFLTGEPAEVLRFLGLDEATWWKSFQSIQDMFEYAARCRMFWIKEAADEREIIGEVFSDVRCTDQIEGQQGGESGKKKLKHNDRQRMSKRPIFKRWIEEFIPQCREQGRFLDTRITREQVRDEAFESFGVKEDYETKLRNWKVLRNEEEALKGVKGSVPSEGIDHHIRAAAIRTIRPVVMEDQTFDGARPNLKNEGGLYDIAAVKEFVMNNWERAGEIGMARLRALPMKK